MDLLLTVMIAGFCLVLLVIVMVTAAARADHAITLKPPLATLGEIDAQIRGRTITLEDLEGELQKRREAIANVAEVQADVDALIRQKEELLAEWHQLEDRRQEVLALRQETDEAQTSLAEVTRDLSEKAIELEQVEARLNKAEQLVGRTAELEETQAKLEEAVASLREEHSDLQALKLRESELREELEKFQREVARFESEIENYQNRQQEAEQGAQVAQARLEELKTDYTDEATKLAANHTELVRIEAQRAELLAQIEALKEKTGIGGGGAGAASNPLGELLSLPPVLEGVREWPEREASELETDALHRVSKHMKAQGLEYHTRVIRAFHTAMKVNETTQMAVLAGISGTGKSQLPRQYAHAMGIGFLQVPVQPRWDSPQDLMGFYNYIEGKFRPTDLARSMYHMDKWNGPEDSQDLQDRMMLVLLDEMNLARVEYYFSDFLSRLESRPGINQADRHELRKDAELELEIPMPNGKATPRIFPGYNILFAGTMNEDESTQSLSDKVVDRANTMRFAAPKSIAGGARAGETESASALTRSQWCKWVKDVDTLGADRDQIEGHVDKMAVQMAALGKPFGHRLGRAIMAYAANYPEDNGRRNITTALADQVEMRLLPKLRGVEMDAVGHTLGQLADYVENDLTDAILAEAIRSSIHSAEEGTGQFVWRGVTR